VCQLSDAAGRAEDRFGSENEPAIAGGARLEVIAFSVVSVRA
jgi:hypothetical protein